MLKIPVPVFNIIKYILAGLLIGVLSEFSASSLEKCRSAFLLKTQGKFQLRQGFELFQENRIFRTFRWRGRFLTTSFTTLLTILIIVGDGSLELGLDSIPVPQPQIGTVQVGRLDPVEEFRPTGSSNSWVHIEHSEHESRLLVSNSEPSKNTYKPSTPIVFGKMDKDI